MNRLVALSMILAVPAVVGCSDSSNPISERGAGEGDGLGEEWDDLEKVPTDEEAEEEVCEPCIAGTVECVDGSPDQIKVCKPDGFCHVKLYCPRAEEGGPPMYCDQETKECMARVCEPDTFESCKDAKTAVRCNVSGTAVEDVICHACVEGDDPENPIPCVCKDQDLEAEPPVPGGCAPLVCRPGDTACFGDEEIHICNDDGTGWDFQEDCNENRSRICEVSGFTEAGAPINPPAARCVSLCEEAQKLKSYIGCEYWAADLDNAFLSRGTGEFIDAQGKQFAVVVSNVSGGDRDFVATVQSKQADGPVWCKKWDPVPGFPDAGDTRFCYPNKGECEVGERCEIIIEYEDGGQVRVPREVCVPHEQGGGDCKDNLRIEPGALRIINLPRADLNGTMIGTLAYQITSDVPITAYQFNPLENEQVFSNDASLLLPINALGKDYLVMAREQTFDILRTFTTVIAVRPGETEVVVRTTARTLPGPGIAKMEKDQQRRFTLEQFQILNLESNCPSDSRGFCEEVVDFTGTEVYANKLIAVFGGSEASNAPNTNHCIEGACWDGTECDTNADCNRNITCCADHLEQQLFPVSTWGTRYVASKSSRRGEPLGTGLEPDVWRILAAKDGTEVTTTPHQVNIPGPLNRGEWVDFESTEDFEVTANQAILFGQFLAAEHAPGPNTRGDDEPGDAQTGDPAFMLGVPVEQYREDFVILAPDKYEYDFANIVVPTGTQALFDGAPLPRADFEPIADGEFSVLRLQIDDGVHQVKSVKPTEGECRSDSDCTAPPRNEAWRCLLDSDPTTEDVGTCEGPAPKFGVVVYGYDQYVSYGYPGGLNLKRINQCQDDTDCPEGAFCCTADANCSEEDVGECVGR